MKILLPKTRLGRRLRATEAALRLQAMEAALLFLATEAALLPASKADLQARAAMEAELLRHKGPKPLLGSLASHQRLKPYPCLCPTRLCPTGTVLLCLCLVGCLCLCPSQAGGCTYLRQAMRT